MAKPKRDPVREERIHEEVIVDAYGPAEQAIGWYYYLEDKIRFPFQAKCIASKMISPLQRGESVEVRGMAPEDKCSGDMLVLIRWQRRTVAVPLSHKRYRPGRSNARSNQGLALLGGPGVLLLIYVSPELDSLANKEESEFP
jgi:hypothetical protein